MEQHLQNKSLWDWTLFRGKKKSDGAKSGLFEQHHKIESLQKEIWLSYLKGTYFVNVAQVQKAKMEYFKGLSLKSFAEYFQAWDWE